MNNCCEELGTSSHQPNLPYNFHCLGGPTVTDMPILKYVKMSANTPFCRLIFAHMLTHGSVKKRFNVFTMVVGVTADYIKLLSLKNFRTEHRNENLLPSIHSKIMLITIAVVKW